MNLIILIAVFFNCDAGSFLWFHGCEPFMWIQPKSLYQSLPAQKKTDSVGHMDASEHHMSSQSSTISLHNQPSMLLVVQH